VDEEALIRRADAAFAGLIGESEAVLVALSGGPDSTALLVLLTEWAASRSTPSIAAATVDHGLRAGSAAEAEHCAALSRRLGVPHATLCWEGPKPETGLQEAAREARYRLLAAHAGVIGARHVVTAHHAEDQAETVLMRLSAGSGIGGLGGIRPSASRDGVILVRPLLDMPKADLVAFCAARRLGVIADPSNADPRFARARWREAWPALAAAGLTTGRLARLASRAARADAALDAATGDALARAGAVEGGAGIRCDWAVLAPMPDEIRLRALLRLVAGPESSRLEQAESLLAEIDAAAAARSRLRRTLGARLVTLGADGVLTVERAPPRRQPVSSS
jgi:tRNA(Ile)-lysidine synthase